MSLRSHKVNVAEDGEVQTTSLHVASLLEANGGARAPSDEAHGHRVAELGPDLSQNREGGVPSEPRLGEGQGHDLR